MEKRDAGLSARARTTALSPTLEVFDMAALKRAAGEVLHDFGVGEPQLPTPSDIANAGREAIRRGLTRYTANAGTPELRAAVAAYLRQSRPELNFTADEILISSGAKQSVYLALAALADPGDEVLIPLPAYPSYGEMVRLCGAVPRYLQPDPDTLKINAGILKEALTDKVKVFILNQPSNPSGRAYSRSELAELHAVLKDRNVYVISDEIYSDIVREDFHFCSYLQAAPEAGDRHLLISGASKSFAMTGWRIGFTAGPKRIIQAMNRIQNHVSGHASSVSQAAACEAYYRWQIYTADIRRAFDERRSACRGELARIAGLRWVEPDGAFYYFVDVQAFLPARGRNGELVCSSRELSLYLLDGFNIVTVPGEAFRMENFLRMSCTAGREALMKGLAVFAEAMEELESYE